MVITEPAVPSARLLGLSLKQYPRNEERMLNKDLTRIVQSLSRVRQNQQIKERGLKASAVVFQSVIVCLKLVIIHYHAQEPIKANKH